MEAEILNQVDTYGCTTAPIAARCFCSGDEKQAASSLHNLVRKKQLKWCDRYGPVFFVRYNRWLEEKRELRGLRDDYNVLAFCLKEGVERFSKDTFFELLGPFIERTGHTLKYGPAYQYGEGLSLVRVHHRTPKGRVGNARIDLERFVNLPQFAVWAMLSQGGMFCLTYLVPEGWAEELTRWLEHDPLMSNLAGKPLEIPVRVEELENLTPRKDKTPKPGLLSSPSQKEEGSPIIKPPASAVGVHNL